MIIRYFDLKNAFNIKVHKSGVEAKNINILILAFIYKTEKPIKN